MRTRWLVCTVLLITLCVSQRARAGPLRDVEERASAREQDASDRAEGRSERGAQHSSDKHSESAGRRRSRDAPDRRAGPLERAVVQVLLSPWTLPHALVDDPCYERFAEFPYAEAPGQLRPGPVNPGCILQGQADLSPARAASRRVAGQLEFEGSYLLGYVFGGSVGARAQLPRRFSLEARLTYWEDLKTSPREQVLGGTAHLSFRFAQSRRLAFRTGAGLRVFALDHTQLGLDLLYGVDVFGRRPILAHLELHGGTLHQALAAQARLTLGVQVWKLELYAGYDHQVFASRGKLARLSGPVLGVRAWF